MKQNNLLKQIFIKILLIFVIVIIALQFCSCSDKLSGGNQSTNSDMASGSSQEKIGVIVSILPQVEFAGKVGKDRIKVTVMVLPGASPHTYEPTPGQLQEVSKAMLYAKVGSGVEFELAWMGKITEMNSNMLIADCSKGISLIGTDPHIWLSIKNATVMVENIYEGLVEVDPAYMDFYYKNKNDFQKELNQLDKQIKEVLKDKKNRKILVFHPSWTYFAANYDIEQIPIEVEGKEPTIREMEEVIEQAKEHDIKIVFASPEFSTKSAETIADEIGGAVVLVSPLEKDYIKNMEKIAAAFAESML